MSAWHRPRQSKPTLCNSKHIAVPEADEAEADAWMSLAMAAASDGDEMMADADDGFQATWRRDQYVFRMRCERHVASVQSSDGRERVCTM